MPGCYLATNVINDDSDLTPSTEDEDYPVENIYDRVAARVFRGTSKTALSIIIDLGAAVQCDTFAIINHNFTQGATITLKNGTSSPPTDVVAVIAWREFDIWKTFAAISRRYWSITIADSNSEYLAIGQILLGSKINLPRARRIGESYSPNRQRELIGGETYAGVSHNYYLFDRKTFNPVFRTASAAELEIFDGMDRALYGNVYPFLYVPDVAGTDCYYVKKDPQFEAAELGRIAGGELVHELSLNLVEESRGLNILE
jgi:hypothetical protein